MTAARINRISDAWGIAPFLPAPHRAPAAGVGSLPASAAFSHFTESCPSGGSFGQVDTAPAVNPAPTHPAGAVVLSAQAMILLRAISAYEQVNDATAVTLALATHASKIGAGLLARACLDEIERGGALTHNRERKCAHGGAGGVNADPADALAGDDLHAVPEFRRVGENRFRSRGP